MSQDVNDKSDLDKNGSADVPRRVSEWLSRTFPGHEKVAVCAFIGLVVGILVLLIGFWQSLLIAIFVVAGVAVGQALEGDPKIIRTVKKWISDRG